MSLLLDKFLQYVLLYYHLTCSMQRPELRANLCAATHVINVHIGSKRIPLVTGGDRFPL